MSTRLRYAVMFMVSLVQQENPGVARPKRASIIADKQSLSEGYLERVVMHLKNKGLVKSRKGPGGGYSLNMPPERITLDQLLFSVGDKIKMVRCKGEDEGCASAAGEKCNSHDLWEGIERYMMHYLSNTTLLDVFNNTLKEFGGGDRERIYADNNSTSEMCPQVRHKMGNALLFGNFYNPSAVYSLGQKSRKLLEDVRRVVIEVLDARGYDVVFTSSGTEANNLVFNRCVHHHIISAVEHPSVTNAATNPRFIPVDSEGVISLTALESILKDLGGEGALVSVMLANNETGVIQPVREVVGIARKYGAVVHTDAVQACGKIPMSVLDLGADFVTISSHKIGGMLGAGALLYNKYRVGVVPMLHGGMQENGLRAGTENVHAIYSMAVALENLSGRLKKMADVLSARDLIENRIREVSPKSVIFGSGAIRLPNTTCVSMPGVSSETQLIGFDSKGIAVGIGSACSSGKRDKSHVLSAVGAADEHIRSAIRISLGPDVDIGQAKKIADCWCNIYRGFDSLN